MELEKKKKEWGLYSNGCMCVLLVSVKREKKNSQWLAALLFFFYSQKHGRFKILAEYAKNLMLITAGRNEWINELNMYGLDLEDFFVSTKKLSKCFLSIQIINKKPNS